MSIERPDDLKNRNPARFIVDSADVKGGLMSVDDLLAPDLESALGENKAKVGQAVWVVNEGKKYVLINDTDPTDPNFYELEGTAAAQSAAAGLSLIKGLQVISATAGVSDGTGVVQITNSPIITMPDPTLTFYFDAGIKSDLLFDNKGDGIATLSPYSGEEVEETTIYPGEKIQFYSDGTNWRVK